MEMHNQPLPDQVQWTVKEGGLSLPSSCERRGIAHLASLDHFPPLLLLTKQRERIDATLFSPTGRRPFYGSSAEDLVHKICHEVPDMSGLPAGMKHLLMHSVTDTLACSAADSNTVYFHRQI